MARIVKIKAGQKARVRYWTQGHGGCTTVAVLAREPVWAGAGLAGLGLVAGELVDPVAAQWLMEGRHPLTGEVLRAPRAETHPHAKLDGAPFAAALRALAAGRGLEPGQVLRSGRSRERWGRLERALAKAEGEESSTGPRKTPRKKPKKRGVKGVDTSVPYTDLRRLAKDAGLRLEDLYDPKVLEFAWINRDKQRLVGVAAFGMFVAWPKSLSVVAALAPPSVGRVISLAVAETMVELVAAVEQLAGYGSRGRQGGGRLSRHIDGRGLAAIVLPHFLARRTKDGSPGDPHLHAHLTVANLLQGVDDAWGGFGSGGHDLYRHVPVLGELAKARLRQRLHARLGMTFVFEPVTGEWEVVGVPLVLRRAWSSRREEILDKAGPGASAAARRAVSAKLSERRRRESEWEPAVLMERWHTFADGLVDDATAMFAAAVPGSPARTPTVPPTVEEITARLQLPRAVAVRRKGAEFREILAAVIKAFPDNLTGLDQALAMTEQLLRHAGFAVLPHRDATAFRNTARYRVPAALVAVSRNPVGWPDAVTTPQTATKTGKAGQAQQHLDLNWTEPGRARRRRTVPRLATPAQWTDQMEMDLGLNQPVTDPADRETGAGDQTPAEPGIDKEKAERPHRMLVGEDLDAALTAAEDALAQALADADTHALAAAALMAAAQAGNGKAWDALRVRRLRLEEAAVMARLRTEMLKQVETDRDTVTKLEDRAKRLRELAADKARNLIGWKRTGFTETQRAEALALAHGGDEEQQDGSEPRMNRADAERHAARLEKKAADLGEAVKETEKKAAVLYASAVEKAAEVGETAEAAVLEDGWAPWRKAAEERRAVAVDVAAATRDRQDHARKDRAAVTAARDAADALRAEQDLRAQMPPAQRASEDAERAEAAEQARAAAQAARERDRLKRADRAAEQQRLGRQTGGTGRTR
jgi:conjugative relaxase-like TrwC/TraI family protein